MHFFHHCSGQHWFKLAIALIHKLDLEEKEEKKRRRTRAEGVGAGNDFKSYGVRKIQVLALVREVPENYFNLYLIFRWFCIPVLAIVFLVVLSNCYLFFCLVRLACTS